MDAIGKAIAEFPLLVQQNAAKRAMRQGANVLRDEARLRAPKRSGKLAASIKTSVSMRGMLVVAKVRLRGEHAYLGRFIEYGVAAHFISAGAKKGGTIRVSGGGEHEAMKLGSDYVTGTILHPGFAPRPFMRPALEAKGTEAAEAVRQSLVDWLGQGMPRQSEPDDVEE
jgi:HK97 gp10 family phage protein